MTTFENLSLLPELERALDSLSYEIPTAIQARAIPALLEGRDVLGCAQTGTGKTAAFALPILQKLAAAPGRRSIRALVLTPTRELAAQVAESFASYGRFVSCRHLVIYGGVSERPQIAALRRGADVLIATPGRLLDLMDRGHVDLGGVEFFVLDEADRMLDMGFIRDVRRVVAELPRRRQNLLFSATMPREIVALAGSILRDPISIEVAPRPTAELLIEQQVMFVDRPDKRRLLLEVLRGDEVDRVIVFTRTKHGANRLTKQLDRAGVRAAAIHGNKSQGARRRALDDFRAGDTSVLVATDVASRGIDIDDVTHVINFDLPNEPESYVHRIGRTGRAGRSGTAISFCDGTEGDYLRAIEKTIGRSIPVIDDHGYHFAGAVPRRAPRAEQKGRPPRRRGRGSKPGARRQAPRAARPRR